MGEDLTLEQSLLLRHLEFQLSQMNKQQLEQFTLDLYRQMLLQQNSYQELIKHQWGI